MKLFSIHDASLYTGVNPVTLRAWESRYQLIRPLRTEGGHRLFSENDLKQIKTILFLRAKGHALKEIPALLEKYELRQSDLYAFTIPNLIEGLKTFNTLKVQREIERILSQQPIEEFADKTLADILQALKKSLWAESFYFTQERCFFYDQLRFQLQVKLYQSLDEMRPMQIKILGYCAPREISEFYVQIYLLALLSQQNGYTSSVISHIDSFAEIQESCTEHPNLLHIVSVGCDSYQLQQLVEVSRLRAFNNLYLYHPSLGQLNKGKYEQRYLLPQSFEQIALSLHHYFRTP